jgi:F-type H+-transporting ATPase subunit b
MRAMNKAIIAVLLMAGSPALAATGPFFSLRNSNFIVLLAAILFVGILLYARIPSRITSMLDGRAVQIKADLDEARALREEAQTILASYERKQKDVQAQADRIVATAREEALAAAAQAKEDLKVAIARRLSAAEDRIASAETAALRDVREQAVSVAIAAAGDLLAKQMTAETAGALVEQSIKEVDARLH